MAIYLNEDQAGHDANIIAYPHLVLCAGVTALLSDGSLAGCHFTDPTTEVANGQRLLNVIQGSGQLVVALYMACDFSEHVDNWGGLDVVGKAGLINYQGNAYTFDTGCINPQDGTYVAMISRGAGQHPEIRYKRDEKMEYRNPALNPPVGVSRTEHAGLTTQSGNEMHKVSYFWKVKKVNCP
jgi:hypothetical protein